MRFVASFLFLAFASLLQAVEAIPDKVYGVNLGSWLLLEPWMLPAEWMAMGGQICDNCSLCIMSEFALVQAYPDTADELFERHWSTWFTQQHVDELQAAGINTVRIPLGYWIVEPLVDRRTEFYPRGGIRQLQRGLQSLKNAGIQAILDHHALPGVHSPIQMFTGHCTNDVEFYTEYNYHRALVWSAVMTALSHLDPAFGSVFSIEAANEPIVDANQTPGYGDFQKNFVRVVRAVELVLGIPVEGLSLDVPVSGYNFTSALQAVGSSSNLFNQEVRSALLEAVPMLVQLGFELSFSRVFDSDMATWRSHNPRDPLVTNFMDVIWQFNNPPNPADAKNGPQTYDDHSYYNFGGVADPNPEAYMTSICNAQRIQNDTAQGDSPLWFGEWALSTEFNATDAFLYKWADAQKYVYSKSKGWIFWSFRFEHSPEAGDQPRQWSYLDGVQRGFFTKDPSQYHNPNVCAPYVNAQ
ncbi:glycoside hydrolase family 5 protein [Trametes polyzona]|nr:glycoside hydrolase family 5 protein [Trametes polyzona]